jgi:hypothetical protein
MPLLMARDCGKSSAYTALTVLTRAHLCRSPAGTDTGGPRPRVRNCATCSLRLMRATSHFVGESSPQNVQGGPESGTSLCGLSSGWFLTYALTVNP